MINRIGNVIVGLAIFVVMVWVLIAFTHLFERPKANTDMPKANTEQYGPPTAALAKQLAFELQEKKRLENMKPIDEIDAHAKCEIAAKLSSRHPSTVHYYIWGSDFTYVGDKAKIVTTFTAKNSFGAKLTFDIVCNFKGDKIVGVKVNESF